MIGLSNFRANREYEKYAEVLAQAVDRSLLAKRELYDFSMERDYDLVIREPKDVELAMKEPFPSINFHPQTRVEYSVRNRKKRSA
jgi:hypothetical protein